MKKRVTLRLNVSQGNNSWTFLHEKPDSYHTEYRKTYATYDEMYWSSKYKYLRKFVNELSHISNLVSVYGQISIGTPLSISLAIFRGISPHDK